ncbi:phosphonate metabolism transcriptional regulator PhnF [Sneathiella sp.]|jgi:GntR family phosphonate transport system transcriptional regulator|uniref:phosphonate metabolism transcriptional regulator PhnF n=1 Tax=Sneathiella sp. TaxID=1964365 RepID=UPI0039E5D9CF
MEWEKGLSIWKQIERQLMRDIALELFKPGEKLPTEMALARRFNVNRHTVRQAMAALVETNIVRVEQGRGAFVQEQVLDYPLGSRTRFSQIISSRHRLPDKRLISDKIIKATQLVARHLEIKPGDPVIEIMSVSEADGVPLAVGQSLLPASRFEGIVEIFKETKSLTEAFREFNIHDYTRKVTKVSAQLPNGKIAGLLKQQKSRPILVTESVDVDEKGTPIEYGNTSFTSDRVQLLVE